MTSGELAAHGDPPEGSPDVLDDLLIRRAALTRSATGVSAAKGKIERLAPPVHELETNIEARRFEDVERMQLGRMLAAAESRRIERLRRPLLSGWTTLLLLYAAVLALLAVVLWLRSLRLVPSAGSEGDAPACAGVSEQYLPSLPGGTSEMQRQVVDRMAERTARRRIYELLGQPGVGQRRDEGDEPPPRLAPLQGRLGQLGSAAPSRRSAVGLVERLACSVELAQVPQRRRDQLDQAATGHIPSGKSLLESDLGESPNFLGHALVVPATHDRQPSPPRSSSLAREQALCSRSTSSNSSPIGNGLVPID